MEYCCSHSRNVRSHTVEKRGIVLGENRTGVVVPPHLKVPASRLHLLHQNLEQSGIGNFIFAHKGNLVLFVHAEARRCSAPYRRRSFWKALPPSGFPCRPRGSIAKPTKGYRREEAGISSTVSLFQQLFAGGGLPGFGFVGRKALDKALQFFDLVPRSFLF